ncbi:MAG TPA: hypothetical protein DCE09_07710 [Thermoanaerobacter sp.]|nr:hypothetical protein [Thermoanaerobacter sp.]
MAKEIKHINDTVSDLPESFKMTELGPLPEEWKVVRLGKVVKTTKGKRPKDLLSKFSSKTIPYLTADFFRTGVASKYVSLEKKDYVEVGKDDIIFIWDGSNAGDVFLGVEGALASTMIKIEPLINVDKRFLFFFLKTKFELFNSTTTGTTIPHVNKSIFENLLVPLPPLSEQKAIAYVLQTVQRAKEATEKVIQATQELKKSLMRHLFTYGPVPVDEVDKVQLKETEIGLVPEHWEVVRLGDIFEIQQGKALSPKHRMGKSPFPFLRTANILWGQIDLSVVDEMDFTDEEVQRFKLLPGDLLVCEGGDIGRTAIWRGELSVCCYQNHIHRLRSKNQEIEAEFYMYWMQAAILLFSLYLGQENKTTIPNLSKSRLATFAVPFPSLLEQRAIARVLQAVDKKLQVEKIRKQALEILFQSLLHNLMTGKLRVKDTIFHEIKEE